MSKIKVLLVCSGLGKINRGYESFTRECFDELKDDPRFIFQLAKGGGKEIDQEKVIPNFPRNGKVAKFLSNIFKSKDAYFFEQLSFFFSLIPLLFKFRPHVIFYSDFILGTFLWHFREKSSLRYRLLFSNGAPNGPPFVRCDHVQQLLPIHLDIALKGGTKREMQSVIPYGIKFSGTESRKEEFKDVQFKKKLGIPENAKVVISVAAINKHHKRMDYLISEFSKLPAENWYLILLGQFDKESEDVLAIAKKELPFKNYLITSVPQDQVANYYQIADIFVLASLHEGLPRVTIEAMSHGLPVLIHDYTIAKQILGEHGYYSDFTKTGGLTDLLIQTSKQDFQSKELQQIRKKYIYDHYSWEVLNEKYLNMLQITASSNLS